jgi:hypothetical protein
MECWASSSTLGCSTIRAHVVLDYVSFLSLERPSSFSRLQTRVSTRGLTAGFRPVEICGCLRHDLPATRRSHQAPAPCQMFSCSSQLLSSFHSIMGYSLKVRIPWQRCASHHQNKCWRSARPRSRSMRYLAIPPIVGALGCSQGPSLSAEHWRPRSSGASAMEGLQKLPERLSRHRGVEHQA